jgi:hypothetical protein
MIQISSGGFFPLSIWTRYFRLGQMTRTKKQSTEAAVREIRRKTRRKFEPEEKVRIVLEGQREKLR